MPVTAPSPLASIAAAVDRQAASGRAVGPRQAVAPLDALGWWTVGAAYAASLENERGSLRPGLRADLALLPPAALTMPPDQLRRLAPRRLWAAGAELRLEASVYT
jgi:predicted amidohydrolase YtcJ